MSDSKVILLVDDDSVMREGVRILLNGEGYIVLEAESGEEALRKMTDAVDLVILDNVLPGISGLKVCKELRQFTNVPILFLSAKSQESDITIGLMAGGDDYITKPFSYAELIARVKALLRRYFVYRGRKQDARPETGSILTSGRLKAALDRNECWKDGFPVHLTKKEYRILILLMQNP